MSIIYEKDVKRGNLIENLVVSRILLQLGNVES